MGRRDVIIRVAIPILVVGAVVALGLAGSVWFLLGRGRVPRRVAVGREAVM